MQIYVAFILGVALAVTTSAHAEGPHHHNAKRGGKIVESGHHHLELVAKDGTIQIFVEDEDGKPEDVRQAKAKAAILSEGKKEEFVLRPGNGNSLTGTGSFKAVPGATIVITLTMPGHAPEQVRIKVD